MDALRKTKISDFVSNLIDEYISPALGGHEGSCVMLGCVMQKDKITVMISYSGSCESCRTSIHETLVFIKNYIEEELRNEGLFSGEVIVKTTDEFKERANEFEIYSLKD